MVVAAAGWSEERAAAVRALVQAGRPLLVAHPLEASMLFAYELDMIRRDSGAVLVPFLPDRLDPGVRAMRDWIGARPGRVESIILERRLRDRTRNALAGGPGQSTGRTLYDAALRGGARSMRQPVGAIAPGFRADIAVLDADHPLLAGRTGDAALDTWIFSGGNALVKDVLVGGTHVVKDRHHIHEETIARGFRAALRRLDT